MNCLIRKAIISDFDGILKLQKSGYENQISHKLGGPVRESDMLNLFFKVICDKSNSVLVGVDQDHVVGVAWARESQSYVNTFDKNVTLLALFVDEFHRNTKLGKALLEFTIEWAKERKAISIVVFEQCHESDHIGQMYKKMGFMETERLHTLPLEGK